MTGGSADGTRGRAGGRRKPLCPDSRNFTRSLLAIGGSGIIIAAAYLAVARIKIATGVLQHKFAARGQTGERLSTRPPVRDKTEIKKKGAGEVKNKTGRNKTKKAGKRGKKESEQPWRATKCFLFRSTRLANSRRSRGDTGVGEGAASG